MIARTSTHGVPARSTLLPPVVTTGDLLSKTLPVTPRVVTSLPLDPSHSMRTSAQNSNSVNNHISSLSITSYDVMLSTTFTCHFTKLLLTPL